MDRRPDTAAPGSEGTHTVRLGEVVGVFGIHGELRIHLHHREGATLAEPRLVDLVGPASRQTVRMSVRSGAGRRVLARVDGVDTPEAARELIGRQIEVDRSSLPPPEPGEFYVHDLLGLRVVDVEGRDWGAITDVVNGPVDVWVVDEGAAFLVASREVVLEVDLAAGRVRVAAGVVETG